VFAKRPGGPYDVRQLDAYDGVTALDVEGHDLDQVAEPALQCGLDGEFEGADQFGAVRGEDQVEQSAAEVGPHHPLAGAGEQQLLDQVVDVLGGPGVRGASPAVGVEGERDVGAGALTR